MATEDTSNEDEKSENLDEEVETAHAEDESSTEDEDTTTEDTEENEEEDSEEDDDTSETDDEEESEFKKRFTQFKGDSIEEYTPELEKAYGHALGEITRLKSADKEKQSKIDSIVTAVAKDPDLAKKLDELMGDSSTVTVDPALMKARQDMEDQMTKDYHEFVDEHPELESDPQLNEQVFALVEEFGNTSRKGGKIMTMKEALTKVYIYLGLNDTKEKVAIKAKEAATKPKTGNTAKKVTKKAEFTEEQLRVAKKWGTSLEQPTNSSK